MSETLTERDAYFKQVACQIHAFPIMGCEQCWRRILDELERQRILAQHVRRESVARVWDATDG